MPLSFERLALTTLSTVSICLLAPLPSATPMFESRATPQLAAHTFVGPPDSSGNAYNRHIWLFGPQSCHAETL